MKTFAQFLEETTDDIAYHKKQYAFHKGEALRLNKQIKGMGPYRPETKPLLLVHAEHETKSQYHQGEIAKLKGVSSGSNGSIEKQLKKNVSFNKAKKRGGF